jgi:hypothetical protein
MLFVGIDPGLNGAVAAVNDRGACALEDLPTLAMAGSARTQRKLCGRGLAEVLRRLVPVGEGCMVMLEDVHVMPAKKSGAAANTSLMHSKGVIEGVLGVLRLKPVLVNSQTWKRFYGLINPDASDTERKAAAIECARRLYPSCAEIARAKDHNRAEAILIAHYGMRKLA